MTALTELHPVRVQIPYKHCISSSFGVHRCNALPHTAWLRSMHVMALLQDCLAANHTHAVVVPTHKSLTSTHKPVRRKPLAGCGCTHTDHSRSHTNQSDANHSRAVQESLQKGPNQVRIPAHGTQACLRVLWSR